MNKKNIILLELFVVNVTDLKMRKLVVIVDRKQNIKKGLRFNR